MGTTTTLTMGIVNTGTSRPNTLNSVSYIRMVHCPFHAKFHVSLQGPQEACIMALTLTLLQSSGVHAAGIEAFEHTIGHGRLNKPSNLTKSPLN